MFAAGKRLRIKEADSRRDLKPEKLEEIDDENKEETLLILIQLVDGRNLMD